METQPHTSKLEEFHRVLRMVLVREFGDTGDADPVVLLLTIDPELYFTLWEDWNE